MVGVAPHFEVLSLRMMLFLVPTFVLVFSIGSRVWLTAGNRPGDFESASTQMISIEQSRDPTSTLGLCRRLPTSLQEPRSSPSWMPATAIGLSRLIESQL